MGRKDDYRRKIEKYAKPTGADTAALIFDILASAQDILGNSFVGMYLYGSLITGDFKKESSDIDLLVIFRNILDKKEQLGLKHMHERFLEKYPIAYRKHIDLEYRPLPLMKSRKADSKNPQVIVMRYGNFFKARKANDIGWLINLFVIRKHAVSLLGPSIKKIVPEISSKEFKKRIKDSAKQWTREVKKTKGSLAYQAYAVLTLCRAFCRINLGRQLSKEKAAKIVQKEFPEWSELINFSVSNYSGIISKETNVKTNYQRTKKFVDFIVQKLK